MGMRFFCEWTPPLSYTPTHNPPPRSVYPFFIHSFILSKMNPELLPPPPPLPALLPTTVTPIDVDAIETPSSSETLKRPRDVVDLVDGEENATAVAAAAAPPKKRPRIEEPPQAPEPVPEHLPEVVLAKLTREELEFELKRRYDVDLARDLKTTVPLTLNMPQLRGLLWMNLMMDTVKWQSMSPFYHSTVHGMRGGIFHGTTGIGKTLLELVSALVIRVWPGGHRKAPQDDDRPLPSLIVTKKGIIGEYVKEYKRYFEGVDAHKILFFHPDYITAAELSAMTVAKFYAYDVVITSYEMLVMAGKDMGYTADTFKSYGFNQNGEPNYKNWWYVEPTPRDLASRNCSDKGARAALLGIEWAFISADESQVMRNPTSKTFIFTAMAPYARYKWCFTATMFANGSADILSQLRFCGYTGCLSFSDWRQGNRGVTLYRQHKIPTAILFQAREDLGTEVVLPEVAEHPLEVIMTKQETQLYRNLVRILRQMIASESDAASVLAVFSYLRRLTVAPFTMTNEAKRINGLPAELWHARRREKERKTLLKENATKAMLTFGANGSVVERLDSDMSSSSSSSGSEDSSAMDEEEEEVKVVEAEAAPTPSAQPPQPSQAMEMKKEEKEEGGGGQGDESDDTLIKLCADRNGDGGIFSSTMNMLHEVLVNKIPSEDKVLIFSAFGSILDLTGHFLEKRLPDINYMMLDGTVTGRARQATMEQFNTDPSIRVLLVNYATGGMGLNLFAANHLVVMDEWFNDMMNEQARARINRPGQNKTVHYWTMMRKGTVDEHIRAICERKRKEGVNFINGRNTSRRHSSSSAMSTNFSIDMIRDLLMKTDYTLEKMIRDEEEKKTKTTAKEEEEEREEKEEKKEEEDPMIIDD